MKPLALRQLSPHCIEARTHLVLQTVHEVPQPRFCEHIVWHPPLELPEIFHGPARLFEGVYVSFFSLTSDEIVLACLKLLDCVGGLVKGFWPSRAQARWGTSAAWNAFLRRLQAVYELWRMIEEHQDENCMQNKVQHPLIFVRVCFSITLLSTRHKCVSGANWDGKKDREMAVLKRWQPGDCRGGGPIEGQREEGRGESV
jgi:hypothetical protein